MGRTDLDPSLQQGGPQFRGDPGSGIQNSIEKTLLKLMKGTGDEPPADWKERILARRVVKPKAPSDWKERVIARRKEPPPSPGKHAAAGEVEAPKQGGMYLPDNDDWSGNPMPVDRPGKIPLKSIENDRGAEQGHRFSPAHPTSPQLPSGRRGTDLADQRGEDAVRAAARAARIARAARAAAQSASPATAQSTTPATQQPDSLSEGDKARLLQWAGKNPPTAKDKAIQNALLKLMKWAPYEDPDKRSKRNEEAFSGHDVSKPDPLAWMQGGDEKRKQKRLKEEYGHLPNYDEELDPYRHHDIPDEEEPIPFMGGSRVNPGTDEAPSRSWPEHTAGEGIDELDDDKEDRMTNIQNSILKIMKYSSFEKVMDRPEDEEPKPKPENPLTLPKYTDNPKRRAERHGETGGDYQYPIVHRGAPQDMKDATAANVREEFGHLQRQPRFFAQPPRGHQLNSIENSILKIMKYGSEKPSEVGMTRKSALIEKQPQQSEATRLEEVGASQGGSPDQSQWSALGALDAAANLIPEAIGAAGKTAFGAAKLGAKTAQKVGQAGVGAAKLGVGATKLGAKVATAPVRAGMGLGRMMRGGGGTPPAGTTPPGPTVNLTKPASQEQFNTMFKKPIGTAETQQQRPIG
jgi:hypothetical protein